MSLGGSRVAGAVGGLALLGLGFALGRWTVPAAPAPATPAASAQARMLEETRLLVAQAETLVRAAARQNARPSDSAGPGVQGALRAELERFEADKRAQAAAEKQAPPAQTPELSSGVRLLDAAIHRHRWTDDDRDQLRELFAGLDPAQREALTSKLVLAINSGQVRVETGDGPFF
jgi:hypothetical protein